MKYIFFSFILVVMLAVTGCTIGTQTAPVTNDTGTQTINNNNNNEAAVDDDCDEHGRPRDKDRKKLQDRLRLFRRR